ncbi:McrB family protein [Tamlana flava]|uniref:McrB family protein n=1 Tax=Tamlana flava TaxID=3158572 RepID=UPI00351BC8D8
MIPNNITKEHLEKAINEIDLKGIRKGRHSSTYDIVHNGKAYPPKLVISIANRYANGTELDSNEFYGGKNTAAFQLLKENGFIIEKKDNSQDYKVITEYISALQTGKVYAANSIKGLVRNENFLENLQAIDNIFFEDKLRTIDSNNYLDIIRFILDKHKIKSGDYNDFNIWSASKTFLRQTNPDFIQRHEELNKVIGFPDNGNGIYKSFLGERNLISYIKDKFETNPGSSTQGIMGQDNKIENNENMDFPLNTILYGPPGTGKTYNTILRAAQIVENRKIESYDEALDIFKSNLHGQIEFITFHQNYSYEDFIQGLRPETDNKSSLVFDKKDGVFKKIADKALENLKLAQKAPDELSNEAKFDKALDVFTDKVLESEDNFKINDTAYIFEVEEDAFRYTGHNWTNHLNGLRMKFTDLKEFFRNDVKSRKDIKGLINISGLAKHHASYYYLVYSEIIKYLPDKVDAPEKINPKNFVIVIDEINRANISRVFGELITLIEPDKRYNGSIPIEARLPSGDPFIVPSNLYIVGTMNTADKSIALLDIALRRRFEFESMYPMYEINGHEIYDVEILRKINEKIKGSKGHDFQIGHAYFMGENKDLVQRMNKKVIPLLLEYYMNDKKEVMDILESAGLKIEENSWPIRIKGAVD